MRVLTLGMLLLSLVGCGIHDHAGGSGMDIPNSVTIMALQGDGSPAKNAKVRIVSESKWMALVGLGKPVVLDSMHTDVHGQFSTRIPDAERVRIEIISNEEGISAPFDSTRTTISLEPLGSIQAQWIPGATVRIAGTSYAQQVDSSGTVLMTEVPRIHSVLIGQENSQHPVVLTSIDLKPQDSLRLGELNIQKDSLLIDDFESKSKLSLLEPFVYGSYWFSIADEHEGGNSTIYPSTANQDDWLQAISDSSAFDRNSLTIHYHVDSSQIHKTYAIFGCTLGNGINGSAIDSIEFMAYSDAPFVFSDGSHTLLLGTNTTSTGWAKFIVSRDKLDSLGITGKIELLQFLFQDGNGSIFRLDNFALFGDPFELLRVE